jgi:hypothetical protein
VLLLLERSQVFQIGFHVLCRFYLRKHVNHVSLRFKLTGIQLRFADSFHFVLLCSLLPVQSFSKNTEILTFPVLLLRMKVVFSMVLPDYLKIVDFQVYIDIVPCLVEVQRVVFTSLSFDLDGGKGKRRSRAYFGLNFFG